MADPGAVGAAVLRLEGALSRGTYWILVVRGGL